MRRSGSRAALTQQLLQLRHIKTAVALSDRDNPASLEAGQA